MKKYSCLLIAALITLPAFAQVSEADKSFTIGYLKSTHTDIVNLVSDMDESTFNYKPESGGWSVANNLEHILITEAAFMGMVQGTVAQNEASPEADNSMRDGNIIGDFANRGTKVKTFAQFEPSGKWTTKDEMLAELKSSREKIISYIKSTDHTLRHYSTTLPVYDVDLQQVFLIVAAHSQRHMFQMREVLAEMEAM